MAVKVYGTLRSGCTQRVLACFIEKGVEFEIVDIDLQAGEQKRPEFLLLQPFGQVPVIQEGDFRLYESRAIVRYYANKYASNGPDLLGGTLEEKAMVDQWLEVEAHNFNDLVYTVVIQLLVLPQMGKRSNLDLVHTCEQKLEKVMDVYEERLSKSSYLAGNSFSLADLSHLPAIRFLIDEAKMEHLVTERKNVYAWWKDISSRPAWKKLMNISERYPHGIRFIQRKSDIHATCKTAPEAGKGDLDVYEEGLSKSSYLAGNSFSLADLSHLPAISFLIDEAKNEHLVTERKNVYGWWQKILIRPAWKKLMKISGLSN